MSNLFSDYHVSYRSDSNIHALSMDHRRLVAKDEEQIKDIIAGVRFIYRNETGHDLKIAVTPNAKMVEAEATWSSPLRQIQVRQSVFDAAKAEEGHAIFTIAHELGHAVMHSSTVIQFPRMQGGNKLVKNRDANDSAEHQADHYARCLLASDVLCQISSSAFLLSKASGLPLKEAEERLRYWKMTCLPRTQLPEVQAALNAIKSDKPPLLVTKSVRKLPTTVQYLFDRLETVDDSNGNPIKKTIGGYGIRMENYLDRRSGLGWMERGNRIYNYLEIEI